MTGHRARIVSQFGRFIVRCECGWISRSFAELRQAQDAHHRHTNSFEDWESPYDAV